MKRHEYAKSHRIKTEEEWANHFKYNLHTGHGPVSMVSCPKCDEILTHLFQDCPDCGYDGNTTNSYHSRNELYDALCRVLTNHEDPASPEERTSEGDLYNMLIDIQNNWDLIRGDI